MRRLRVISVISLLIALAACPLFAHGGGGITFGSQYYDPDFANRDLSAFSVGGFGYGVSADGQRIGGFGMAFTGIGSTAGQPDISGGIGGLITGQELRIGPFTVAVNLWLGLGGLAVDFENPSGFMAAFGELNLELGIPVTRWMQLVGYAGFQVLGNLIPGMPFEDVLIYTPVVGVRIRWGST